MTRAPAQAPAAQGRTSGASWSHPHDDVTEEAVFLDVEGSRVLAFLHRPTSRPPVGGVVINGSIYEDFSVNYRRELLVARELARRGFATVRYHYRGFGNSDASPSGAVTFGSMVADATAATAWLTERTGVTEVVNIGSRVGALVATHLASAAEGSPLVLWAPLASGADFFRGMSRASLVAGVRAEVKKRQPSASFEERLKATESVEMLGNDVRSVSYEDIRQRVLPTSVGVRPMYLLQLGTGEELSVANQKLVAGWREGGATVDVLAVPMRQLWTVPAKWEADDDKPHTKAIVAGIAGWVEGTVGAR